MKRKVKIIETYVYYIEVEADSNEEAIAKAEEYYKKADDNYFGVADANTHESTKFRIVKNK